MSKKEPTSIGRRDFFKTAGAGAAGAAAVGLTATQAGAVESKDKSAKSAGYRETEHVKKYYELSRF